MCRHLISLTNWRAVDWYNALDALAIMVIEIKGGPHHRLLRACPWLDDGPPGDDGTIKLAVVIWSEAIWLKSSSRGCPAGTSPVRPPGAVVPEPGFGLRFLASRAPPPCGLGPGPCGLGLLGGLGPRGRQPGFGPRSLKPFGAAFWSCLLCYTKSYNLVATASACCLIITAAVAVGRCGLTPA